MLPRACRSVAALSMAMGLAAASHADDWGTVVAISSTMGVQGDRVCVGEATRGDIGCPTYAPQVLPDGTVSATNGEFSRLRVISGTFAVNEGASNRGMGLQLNTDAFGKNVWQMRSNGSAPYPVLIDVGDRKLLYVNYTTANRPAIGIGTTDPSTALHVSGTLRIADSFEACDASRVGAIRYAAGEFSFCRNGSVWEPLSSISGDADRIVSGTTSLVAVSSTGFVSLTQTGTNTGWFDPARGLVTLGVSATGRISATSGYYSGRVGIGTQTPNTALEVSGAIYVSSTSSALNSLYVGGITTSGQSGTRIHYSPLTNSAYYDTVGSQLILRVDRGSGDTYRMVLSSSGLIGMGITSPTTQLEVSGTVSATRFVGDGSGLTGVVASTADRIVSGTTSLLAVSGTGFVSLTQAGTNTGWFDPTRGLVTLGVSSTGTISSTNAYFSEVAGVGAVPITTATLYVSGSISTIQVGNIGSTAGSNTVLANFLQRVPNNTGDALSGGNSVGLSISNVRERAAASGGYHYVTTRLQREVDTSVAKKTWIDFRSRNSSTNNTIAFGEGASEEWMRIDNGNVGIGLLTPTVPLEVSGTVSATRFIGDGSQLTGVVAATADRIVSGTTSLLAVSSTGFVSLTQAGTNTGWFDPTRGLVTLGVSATGAISATRIYASDRAVFPKIIVPMSGVSAPSGTQIEFTNGLGHLAMKYILADELGATVRRWDIRLVSPSGYIGFFSTSSAGSGGQYFMSIWPSQNALGINLNNTSNLVAAAPSATLHVSGTILTTSWTGINFSSADNTTPTAPLEVSGTVSATYVKLADNDDKPCAPENNGTIRFFNGRISLCRTH